MNENTYYPDYYGKAVVKETVTNKMIRNVYLWICGAIAIAGITAYYVATTPNILSWVFGSFWVFIGLIIVELAFLSISSCIP